MTRLGSFNLSVCLPWTELGGWSISFPYFLLITPTSKAQGLGRQLLGTLSQSKFALPGFIGRGGGPSNSFFACAVLDDWQTGLSSSTAHRVATRVCLLSFFLKGEDRLLTEVLVLLRLCLKVCVVVNLKRTNLN